MEQEFITDRLFQGCAFFRYIKMMCLLNSTMILTNGAILLRNKPPIFLSFFDFFIFFYFFL